MKHYQAIAFSCLSILLMFIFQSCSHVIPDVETEPVVSQITKNSAIVKGTVINNGGLEIVERGICYGTTINPIERKEASTGGMGGFQVSLTGLSPDTDYFVRAYAVNDEGPGYGNNQTFKTLPEVGGYITIISPNSSTSWQAGTTQTITWDYNISSDVEIELYKGSTLVEGIVASTASDGSYDWDIPSNLAYGTDYRIKITSTTDGSIYDWSDNFTISAEEEEYITINSPTSSTSWQAGTTQTITWDYNISSDVEIELYKGSTLVEGIVGSTASDGSYDWDIPSNLAYGTDYRIKITSTTDGSINDWSAYFTITEADYITITSPTSSTSWQAGTTQTITWDDNISSDVEIELYKGSTLVEGVVGSTASDGSYDWDIPSNLAYGTDYRIKITSTTDGSINDWSAYFTITEADYITITSPTSSTSWQAGTTQTITWDDNISSDVVIELYNGASFISTIVSPTESDGSYDWDLPSNLAYDTDYRIKITSTTDGSIYDWSDYFTISAVVGDYLTITSPNSSTVWQAGTTHTITWDYNISSDVELAIYRGELLEYSIIKGTPCDGSYEWLFRSDLPPSNDYRIAIASYPDDSVSDWSEYFTITAAGK